MIGDYRFLPWLPVKADRENLSVQIPGPQRPCGDCMLCCKVLPVADYDKSANSWCRQAKVGVGCQIYADRPKSCRVWSCLWVLDKSLPEELKPNRSHVIFDMMSDEVVTVAASGEREPRRVVQLWVDQTYPGAHREPAVRHAIQMIADKHGLATLARIGNRGILIVAPSLNTGRKWIEVESPLQERAA